MADVPGMVDVSGKDVTVRTARARATILVGTEAYEAVKSRSCPKGDVLETAKIAAVQAAKGTPGIIPMCHPILIESVKVDFDLNDAEKAVTVEVAVKSSGKTGVEMEALTAASASALTIYDMLKYIGKGMTISQIRLIEKTGGASGDYRADD